MSEMQIDSASGGAQTSEEACAQRIKKRGTLRVSATRSKRSPVPFALRTLKRRRVMNVRHATHASTP
jgi:hypothetical protein